MIINIKNFNLEQIADSGQCFRWRKLDEGKYLIPAYDHQVTVAQSGEKFEFSCTGEEYKKIWEHYFDMKVDYGRIIDAIDDNDTFLKEAAAYGSGIRILNQELWEMIISYIISQNNNIPRIKKGIEAVCDRYKAVVCKETECQPMRENADKSIKNNVSKNIKEEAGQSKKELCADKTTNDIKQNEITLFHGKIEFNVESTGKKIVMQPLQKVTYNVDNAQTQIENISNISWENGRYNFEDVPLPQLIETVNQMYNTNIVLKRNLGKKALFSGSIRYDDTLDDVLDKICFSLN